MVIDLNGISKQISREEFILNKHLYVGVNYGKIACTDIITNKKHFLKPEIIKENPSRYRLGFMSKQTEELDAGKIDMETEESISVE